MRKNLIFRVPRVGEKCPDQIKTAIRLAIDGHPLVRGADFQGALYKPLVEYLRSSYHTNQEQLQNHPIQSINFIMFKWVEEFFKKNLDQRVYTDFKEFLKNECMKVLKLQHEYNNSTCQADLAGVVKSYIIETFSHDNRLRKIIDRNKVSSETTNLVSNLFSMQEKLVTQFQKLSGDTINALDKTIKRKCSTVNMRKKSAYNKMIALKTILDQANKGGTLRLLEFRNAFMNKKTQKIICDGGDPVGLYFLKTVAYAFSTLFFGAGLAISYYKKGTVRFWRGSSVNIMRKEMRSRIKANLAIALDGVRRG